MIDISGYSPKRRAPYVPSPADLGLPAKFAAWRPAQAHLIDRITASRKRVLVARMPTGGGKSGCLIGAALAAGWRALILTATKALQDQYINDFTDIGLRTVKGMDEYPCVLFPSGMHSCAHGPCHAGIPCSLRFDGCHYYDAVANARRSSLVVTNYAFWLSGAPDRLGDFDVLMLDEAGFAHEWLVKSMRAHMGERTAREFGFTPIPRTTDLDAWRDWAVVNINHAKAAQVSAKKLVNVGINPLNGSHPTWEMERLREAVSMERTLEIISKLDKFFVCEYNREFDNYEFEPIWAGKWAEAKLFRAAPRIVMASATISPLGVKLLGVREDEFEFFDYPSDFPLERCPVYIKQTARMSNEMSVEEWDAVIADMDAIMDGRPDRKGIIHAVSYDRALLFKAECRNGHRMIVHPRGEVAIATARFRRSPPGTVLVSPAIGTGVDFADEACEYVIVPKLPFGDPRSAAARAKRAHNKQWFVYDTAQLLEQMCGRGMRSQTDYCETFILDGNWRWFRPAAWSHFSRALTRRFRDIDSIPAPTVKL